SSRRRHTRWPRDWSSDVCSSDLGTPRAFNHYPWGWAWAGNTPFKRFKRDTHEGGVADPLIVHWPARFGKPGETRDQYVHAIDVKIGRASCRERGESRDGRMCVT